MLFLVIPVAFDMRLRSGFMIRSIWQSRRWTNHREFHIAKRATHEDFQHFVASPVGASCKLIRAMIACAPVGLTQR